MIHNIFRAKFLTLKHNLSNLMCMTMHHRTRENLSERAFKRQIARVATPCDYAGSAEWLRDAFRGVSFVSYEQLHISDSKRKKGVQCMGVVNDSDVIIPEDALPLNAVNEELAHLSEDLRVPLELSLAGFSVKEIAKYLHLSVFTIRSRLMRARKQMRTAISKNPDG